jgi:hypothetical protein
VWIAVTVAPVSAAAVALGAGVAVADEQDGPSTANEQVLRNRRSPAAPAVEAMTVGQRTTIRHRRARPEDGTHRRHRAKRHGSTARPTRRAADSPTRRPAGRLAPSSAAETRHAAVRSRFNEPGYCLAWSRQQADIPARYPDAATAWAHATGKRRNDRTPPAGAAVYWTGGSEGYGHVAISVGGGRVRSSDAGGAGRVSTVPVEWVARTWGLKYAGWADSINGYTIPGVGRGA